MHLDRNQSIDEATSQNNNIERLSENRKSVRSQLSQVPRTGQALRWEMQAKDIHMGILMKNEKRLNEKLSRENQYATVFGNFQRSK